MTRLLDLAASPGTPPLSLSNSYHCGDFSALAASGSDSVIWPACVNPLLSLSESYHFGDFSAPAAPGPDSFIWPACVKPSLSLSESCHFGDFSASAALGPDYVIWPAYVNPSLSISSFYNFGDFSASAAPGPHSLMWAPLGNLLLAGRKHSRCPHDIGRNLCFNHLPLYVYIGRPSSTHVYYPYIIGREIWESVGSAFRTTHIKSPQ